MRKEINNLIDGIYIYSKDKTKKSKYHLDKYYPDTNIFDNTLYVSMYNDFINTKQKRKPAFTICNKKGYFSGIFLPDIDNTHLGFGDIENTYDLLLFIIDKQKEMLMILHLKGKKPFSNQMFEMMKFGELESEINDLLSKMIVVKNETITEKCL